MDRRSYSTKCLEDFCQENFFEKKILIVNRNSEGYRLLHHYVSKGGQYINLSYMTIRDIAIEICNGRMLNYGIKLLEEYAASRVLLDILKDKSYKGSLKYFHETIVDFNLSRAIYQTILEVKMSGIMNLDNIASNKFEDIKMVLEEYKSLLQAGGYFDMADVYNEACNIVVETSETSGCVYAISSNIEFSPLQARLFECLTKGRFAIIENPIPQGVKIPRGYYISSLSSKTGAANKLLRLYSNEQTKDGQAGLTPDIMFFKAFGEVNEIKNVYREIKKRGLRLDDCVLIYSDKSYAEQIYTLSQKLGINTTMGDGISLSNTRVYSFTGAFLKWIEAGCKICDLTSLFKNQEVVVRLQTKDEPLSTSLARNEYILNLIQDSRIGWRLERYIDCTRQKLSECDSNSAKAMEASGYRWLLGFFEDVISIVDIDENDGQINLDKLIKGLSKLINKYLITEGPNSKIEEAAKYRVLDTLAQLQGNSLVKKNYIDLTEAFKIIRGILDRLSIAQANPKPGAVHACQFTNCAFVGRKHAFVVGLDNERFPGKQKESPILLDDERVKLSQGLRLSTGMNTYKLFKMLEALCQVEGSITFSLSNFSSKSFSYCYPSELFCELYRLEHGEVGYQKILEAIDNESSFIQENEEDVIDRLDSSLMMCKQAGGSEDSTNPLIAEDVSDTCKLGGINDLLEKNYFSASALEKLAVCPLKYLYNNAIRLRIPERVEYLPYSWLDHAEKGMLYHEILEEYYRYKYIIKSYKDIRDIIDEKIALKLKDKPYPSEVVFKKEREELETNCVEYVNQQDKEFDTKGKTPIFMEMSFRGETKENGIFKDVDFNNLKPAMLEISEEIAFKLTGVIDRVDLCQDGSLEIVDYKSGSSDKFYVDKKPKTNENFAKEKALQHYLYTLALEKIMSEKGFDAVQVKKGSYIFVSQKEKFRKLEINQDEVQREQMGSIISEIVEKLNKPECFVPLKEKKDCVYCDFRALCDR